MDREGRLPDGDDDLDEDFSLEWAGVDDPATEGDDVLDVSEDDGDDAAPAAAERLAPHDVPWDENADDTTPQYEAVTASFRPSPPLIDATADDDDEEDDAAPHGDPLEQAADEVFEPERPSARMDSLQDALASIRERVQNLSSSMETEEATAAPGPSAPRASELSLYRQATDDRTLRELQRHSGETEELLRRMSALMQDLSLDLRSIVDAARRAIDQTSEQAESSVELGRLLGDRIEQMDEQLSVRFEHVDDTLGARFSQTDETLGGRFDVLDEAMGERVDHLDRIIETLQTNVGRAFDNMQSHLDKRLSKIEQRSGVGLLREEIGELRADLGELRADIGGHGGENGQPELQERLDEVSGQLDRTLETLGSLVDGAPETDDAVVEEVVSAIKAEAESAVEPFRNEVEELGRQLGDALEREDRLTETLLTLTEEVQRLGEIAEASAASAGVDDDQVETIVAAVVAALGGVAVSSGAAASRARKSTPAKAKAATSKRRAAPKPAPEPAIEEEEEEEPEYDEIEELDVEIEEVEPEPEPEPAPPPRRRGARRKRAGGRARPLSRADIKNVEPDIDEGDDDVHLDVDPEEDPFEALEKAGVDALDLPYATDDEEPIRRARGRGRKKTQEPPLPPAKGRRARSSK